MADTDSLDLARDLAAAALTLARRFAAGATVWCTSPTWPAHGRHVAVEFVHPVIVGKRALPVVNVESPDVVGAVRLSARPGDVVLAVGSADEARVAALVRRADAWGLTSFWLGAGRRPPRGAADHVLWVDGEQRADGGLAARSSDLMVLYHLLWELTHVVFEHPGLLEGEAASAAVACVTCSDEGRVAEVTFVHDAGDAEVVRAGRRERVDVTLVDHVAPGDLVLVHAGIALTRLREEG